MATDTVLGFPAWWVKNRLYFLGDLAVVSWWNVVSFACAIFGFGWAGSGFIAIALCALTQRSSFAQQVALPPSVQDTNIIPWLVGTLGIMLLFVREVMSWIRSRGSEKPRYGEPSQIAKCPAEMQFEGLALRIAQAVEEGNVKSFGEPLRRIADTLDKMREQSVDTLVSQIKDSASLTALGKQMDRIENGLNQVGIVPKGK